MATPSDPTGSVADEPGPQATGVTGQDATAGVTRSGPGEERSAPAGEAGSDAQPGPGALVDAVSPSGAGPDPRAQAVPARRSPASPRPASRSPEAADRVAPPGPRRSAGLSLGDPLGARASEDLDTAWGDPPEAEEQAAARYLLERPPHHGD